MTDLTKSKLRVGAGLSKNTPDRTPTPPAKLMINHGKPNFTLPRTNKLENGFRNGSASPEPGINNNTNNNINNGTYRTNNITVAKSSTFNGLPRPTYQAKPIELPPSSEENEVAKVVLRRPKIPEAPSKGEDDENVPEFIRRQRRIQERLAKENVLDFEKRRSGSFTQCMLSPSKNNRQSFSPTMASPAIVPAFENGSSSTTSAITVNGKRETECEEKVENTFSNITTNGHMEEEEEVAKAIEEVNRAVAGEDDDSKYEYSETVAEAQETLEEKSVEVKNEIKRDEIEIEVQKITEEAAATVLIEQQSQNHANIKLPNGHIKNHEEEKHFAAKTQDISNEGLV